MQLHSHLLLCCLAAVLSLHEVAAFKGTTHLYASRSEKVFHSNGNILIWYGNWWDWKWVIHTNRYVRFWFSDYDVEHCCDKVYVRSQYSRATGGDLQFTANNKGKCDFRTCNVNRVFVLQGPIRVRFVTDSWDVGLGFYFHYRAMPYAFGCNWGPVTGFSGYFTHRSRDVLTYGNNWDCRRVIRSNRIIYISFSSVDVEYYSDKVYLYEDATSVSSSKLHSVVSSSSDYSRSYYLQGPVLVRFVTNGRVTGEGFNVYFSSQSRNYGCTSSSLSSLSGSIRSQLSHLKNYGNNWNCTWILRRSNQFYRLGFTSYDLQYGGDTVYFYENTTSTSGKSPRVTLSSRSHFGREYIIQGPVVIGFTTNSYGVRSGFRLTYATVADGFGCGSTNVTSLNGEIRSKQSSGYGSNWNCKWVIWSDSYIRLQFRQSDLQHEFERIYFYENSTSADSNKLQFTLQSSSHYRREFVLQGPVVILHTSVLASKSGRFRLSYTELPYSHGCANGEIRSPPGAISAKPSHLSSYGNNWDCTWVIQSQKMVHLAFTTCRLQFGADRVSLYEATEVPAASKLKHSVTKPQDCDSEFTLLGPVLVRFQTDETVTDVGFRLRHRQLEYNTGAANCTQNPCRHGGKCAMAGGRVVCICRRGWTGADCGRDVCSTSPCGGGKVCRRTRSSYSCHCPSGHYELGRSCVRNPMLSTRSATVLTAKDFSATGLSRLLPQLTGTLPIGSARATAPRIGVNGYVLLAEAPKSLHHLDSTPAPPAAFSLWTDQLAVRLGPHSTVSFEAISEDFGNARHWNARLVGDIVTGHTGRRFTPTQTLIVTWTNMTVFNPQRRRLDRLCETVTPEHCQGDLQEAQVCRRCRPDSVSHQVVVTRDSSSSFVIQNFGPVSLSPGLSLKAFVGFAEGFGRQVSAHSTAALTAESLPNHHRGTDGVQGRFVQRLARNVRLGDADTCMKWSFLCKSEAATTRSCDACPHHHLQAAQDARMQLRSFDCDGAASSASFDARVCYWGYSRCSEHSCSYKHRLQCCYRISLPRRRWGCARTLSDACGTDSRGRLDRATFCLWQFAINGHLLRNIASGAGMLHATSPVCSEETERQGQAACRRAGMLDWLRRRRPVCKSSSSYRMSARRFTRGDPHFETLDGLRFTFNGHCDFVLAENSSVSVPRLRVEARAAAAALPNSSAAAATAFTAFAVQLGANTDSIALMLSGDRSDIEVLVNSRLVGSAGGNMSHTVTRVQQYRIAAAAGFVLVADQLSGVAVNVSLSLSFLQASVQLPPEYERRVRGLLGNFNGDPSDDLRLRNGSVLPAGSSDRLVHEFGQSWSVSEAEGLLPLRGRRWSDVCDAAFTPAFRTDFTHRPSDMFADRELFVLANRTCGQLQQQHQFESCLFDAAQLHSVSAAEESVRSVQEATAQTEATRNSAPVFASRLPGHVTLLPQRPFSLRVAATDPDGDRVVLALRTSDSLNSTLQLRGSRLQFSGVSSLSRDFGFSVVATDSRGAATEWRPAVRVCDCLNGGFCDFSGAHDDAGGVQAAVCSCPSGFHGDRCERRVCDLQPPPCIGECRQLGSGSFSCSGCPDRLVGDGRVCVPEDPCVSAGCEQLCSAVNGSSYECSCRPGFAQVAGRCVDVNECEQAAPACDKDQRQVCVNTPGSFLCRCPEGRVLDSGGSCVSEKSLLPLRLPRFEGWMRVFPPATEASAQPTHAADTTAQAAGHEATTAGTE